MVYRRVCSCHTAPYRLGAVLFPKEDRFLFPALRRRYLDINDVLAEREQEHVDGDALFADLLNCLSAYEFIGKPKFANFRDTLLRYTAFEKAHAMKEEQLILPVARQHLQPEDWREIDEAFSDHTDPLFGGAPQEEFDELYKAIAAVLPPPHGAGPVWT